MAIEYILSADPEDLSLRTVRKIVKKLTNMERQGSNFGIGLQQNRQFGASSRILTEDQARLALHERDQCEWLVAFYPSKYFLEAKIKLEKGEFPEQIKRDLNYLIRVRYN